MRRVDWCSEDGPQWGAGPETYFPPRISRRKPAWIDRHEVADEYVELLGEVYVALHADSGRLAMMGARALIDVVIRRLVGDQDNFGRGLDALVDKDLVSNRDREIIKAAINAGHASAHRGHKPSSTDVNVVIDIVERMIHAEILTEQAEALKEATPQRKPSAAKNKINYESNKNA
jgi:transcriptional regulator CtsR